MGAFSGEIEVVDETPVVDPTQVNTGQVFDRGYMQNSAIGSVNRNYLTVVNQTAGVAGGGAWGGVPQPRVFGSTIGENAYFIDGMDTTDPTMAHRHRRSELRRHRRDPVPDRRVRGRVRTRHRRHPQSGDQVRRQPVLGHLRRPLPRRTRSRRAATTSTPSSLDTSFNSTRATLGGPILRDRMWFFASYERTNDMFTPDRIAARRRTTRHRIIWPRSPGRSLRTGGCPASTRAIPDDRQLGRLPVATCPRPPLQRKGRPPILSTELTSVLSDALLWNTTLGRYEYESNVYPQSADLSAIGHYNFDTELSTDNYGNQQYWGTNRNDFTTDLTWFVDNLAGSHELKGGVEYSDLYFKTSGATPERPMVNAALRTFGFLF